MSSWTERPSEVANLMNPWFCGLLLRGAAEGYATELAGGLPFELSFLVLPVIMHKRTRASLPRGVATSMVGWIAENPAVLVGMAERVRTMAGPIREAIIVSTARGLMAVGDAGALACAGKPIKFAKYARDTTDEVRECLSRAAFFGRWLASGGTPRTVLALWGLRP